MLGFGRGNFGYTLGKQTLGQGTGKYGLNFWELL